MQTVRITGDTWYAGATGSVAAYYSESGTYMIALDAAAMTLPFAGSELVRTYPCIYPDKTMFDTLPEGWDEWQSAERCTHDYCLEVDGYRRSAPRNDGMTQDDRDAIAADIELVRDEFHGVYPPA